ncbi:NAD(P)/FAD-dependent oxidoreductase [Psychroflexus sp. ALD_RP9]|uniref:NAD(P)/FAD-dependent oxidoreductase n=1 Tax=Psychroflexus sp. ALD_RP9 TaxID=2777186 RepID=UPI001A8EE303|nr:FAD-dependent oxidoreductase [Psychroflexus sp. ALD_RP9]QSS97703.1 FAD-dependent oxidoreductase [Psychroflexus sp. ALD_RP9]
MTHKDVLIIGFGIAGASIAHRLNRYGKSFDIVSNNSQQATRVAGGVLNPIVLKRYKKAWKANEFYSSAVKFYADIESKLDTSFIKQPNLFKLLQTPQDCNDFISATEQPYISNFLTGIKPPSHSVLSTSVIKLGEVNHIYTLDLNTFLDGSISYFNDSFYSNDFNYNNLKVEDSLISYQSKSYQYVIFCEGYGVNHNPYFNYLPIYGNKGEYLIIHSKELNSNHSIYKSKFFLIPLGKHLYKFGANYQRHDLNNEPTEATRHELSKAFEKMFSVNYEIVSQLAGIRPTVKDRRPILGRHPKHSQLLIFNGNGSRGVLASPYLSKNLVQHIFNNQPILEEVDVMRYDV